MSIYAIIDASGLVENIVEYEAQPANPPPGFSTGYTAVLANGAGPGWKYENGAFVAPPSTAPVLPLGAPVLTFLQFLALFTPAEQLAIVGSPDHQVQLFYLSAAGSGGLQLNNAEVIQGVNYLTTGASPILTPAEAARILAGTPPAS